MKRLLCIVLLLLPTVAHAASFRIASGDDDYVVRGNGLATSGWPPAFSTCGTNFTVNLIPSVVAQFNLNSAQYTLDEILLRWNTSAIPAGATITSATLTVKVSLSASTGILLSGDWFNWDGACDSADLTFSTPSGAFTPLNIQSWTTNSVQTITLTNFAANVATGPGAVTYLRLGLVIGAAPVGQTDFLAIYDYAADPANAALLDVAYDQFSPTPTGTVTHTPPPTHTPTSAQTPTRLPTNTPVPGGTPPNTPVPNCGERLPQ